MKIDIKSIANALSSGVSEIKNTSGTVNIREALGEAAEEPKLDEATEAVQKEDAVQQTQSEETTTVEYSFEEVEVENAEAELETGREEGEPFEEQPSQDYSEDKAGERESKEEKTSDVDGAKGQNEPADRPASVADDSSEGEEIRPAEEDEAEEDESEEEASAEPEKIEVEQSEAATAEKGEIAEAEAAEEASEEPETVAEEKDSDEETAGEIVSGEVSQQEQTEPEKKDEPKASSPVKEKILAWGGKYGWLTGIAASFLILIAFMVIYTTMTPREIVVVMDGEKRVFTTEEYTVEGFLTEEKIAICEEDYLSVPLSTFIQEGISFELKHATDFVVTADGKIKKYKSLDDTVQQALDDVGIEVGKLDIVKPAQDKMLEQNMHVIVKRVEIKKEVREEKVAFETIEKDDVTMNEGTSKTVTKGKNGKDKVTYEIKYIDGKEASKKEIDRETITAAVDEVIANGTRINYNGKSYSKKLKVKAYSYTGGGTTAMGTRARVGEIAVDPSVIPLGTNVYIEGVGPRRAEDTGGNIKGNTIDIYMNSQAECIRWGVRYVTIYIE